MLSALLPLAGDRTLQPTDSLSTLSAELAKLQARADAADVGGSSQSLTASIDAVNSLLHDGAQLAGRWQSLLQAQGYQPPTELTAARQLTDRVQERVGQLRPFAAAADAKAVEADPLPHVPSDDPKAVATQKLLRTFLSGK